MAKYKKYPNLPPQIRLRLTEVKGGHANHLFSYW